MSSGVQPFWTCSKPSFTYRTWPSTKKKIPNALRCLLVDSFALLNFQWISTLKTFLVVLNGSNLSNIDMEVFLNGVPIPQSSYRNSFPLPHRTIGLDVLTLLQPFMSMGLPSAFTLLCAAYDRSGLTVSPLQLSAESTVRIQGMSRFKCFSGKVHVGTAIPTAMQWKIIKYKLRVPNHGCDLSMGPTCQILIWKCT